VAVPKGFDVPFRLDKRQASPVSAEQEKLLDRSIRTILLTSPGERVFRPTFGSWLRRMVFANMSEGAGFQAATEIRRALVAWEPRIIVRDILFRLGDNSIQLNIIWQPTGAQVDSSTTIGFEV
jgi:phage baseplate assembly protein W